MSILALLAAVFTLAVAQRLSDDVTEDLATMSREIISKYFAGSKCVAVVTDFNVDIIQYIYPMDMPILHVHLPVGIMRDPKVQSTGKKTTE